MSIISRIEKSNFPWEIALLTQLSEEPLPEEYDLDEIDD